MALCLSTAIATVTLVANAFTLGWTHSIEKIRWEEDWRVIDGGLLLETVRVRGHGAGMEPPNGARLLNGVWEWHPHEMHEELRLTRSEHTPDYTWCMPHGVCMPMSALIASDGGVTRVGVCDAGRDAG